MKKLLFILMLFPSVAMAAAPSFDSTATGYITPWSGQIVFRLAQNNDSALIWVQGYYGTDTSGGVYDYTTDSMQAVGTRYHGNVWCQNLDADSSYFFKLFAWVSTQADDGDSVWSTAATLAPNTTADTASIDLDTALFICDNAGRFYHLTGDKDATRSAIEATTDDMTIDLGGNTVTFCSLDSIEVENWSLETAGGTAELAANWTFSDEGKIKRREGHYYWNADGQPTLYDGGWMVKFATDEYADADTSYSMETTNLITIPAGDGDVYAVSCMIYGYPKDGPSWSSHIITAQLEFIDDEGDTAWAGCWADNYQSWTRPPDGTPIRSYPWANHSLSQRGWQYLYFLVHPDTGDYIGKIRLTIHGTAVDLDSVYADAFRIEPANYYGIFTPYHTNFNDSVWVFPNSIYTASRPNSEGLKVLNGTVRTQRNSHWTHFTPPIYSYGNFATDEWAISGVTAISHGALTRTLDLGTTDFDTVTFCHIIDSGKVISRRDAGWANITLGGVDGTNYIAFNDIDQIRQTGINVGHSPDTTKVKNNLIEWNYIHTNTGVWHTNGFGIQFGGTDNPTRYNTIIGNLNADDNGGGLSGIQFTGLRNKVHDNWIYAKCGRNQEYSCLISYGIQIESADISSGAKSRLNEVYNNDIIAVKGPVGGSSNLTAAGIRMTGPWDDNFLYNNRIFLRDSVTGSATGGYGISISFENLYMDSTGSGDYKTVYSNHTYGNYIQSEGYCIRITNGSLYGGLALSNDTLNLVDASGITFYLSNSDSNSDTTMTFQGNATVSDITFVTDGNITPWWVLTVNTQDESSNPIDGIYISIIGAAGDTLASGTTSGGTLDLMAREFVDDFDSDLDTTFTPYAVHADSSDGSREIDSTGVAVIGPRTVTIVFGDAAGGPIFRKVRVRRQ